MKRTVVQILFSIASTGLLFAGHAAAVTKGEPLPAIDVKGVNQGELNQSTLQGKVTMINFWATWCAACKVELKEMEDHFRAFSGDKDFQMAFVSLDKDPSKAVEWINANLKDPQQMISHLYSDASFAAAETLSVESFPMTFVVGKDGKVAHIQAGYKEGENSTEEMAKTIEGLLRQ